MVCISDQIFFKFLLLPVCLGAQQRNWDNTANHDYVIQSVVCSVFVVL